MKYSARFALLALGSAIALAACGDSGTADADGDGTISADEMRDEMARDGANLRPDPGNYKVTMTLSKAEIPGAPPQMMEMMGSMMNNTFEYCLTPEEAEKGFEESLTEGQDESCKIEQFNLDGGKIEMAMSCSPAEGGEMRMTMNGNVSPTKSDINVVTQGNIAGMGEANIEMSMVQERIGDCEG
ncbi:hypothetical protein MACH24_26300 [Erythrobacter sp. Dej080120_24]|uniref:DUF3617 domain-containing protein n=1 Tax=Erythrobacter sp. Dej080120_24 TaxID=3024837 RepID=UPI000A865AE2|nr:hypothetical protein MACH24_26300 [Erythrobacter sp. Dej080120_24]